MTINNLFRSLQTNVPYLHDTRYRLREIIRDILKIPHEDDFRALPLNDSLMPLCLDIGANRGEAIHSMLIRYKSKCHIQAFEPNPLIFDKLVNRYGNRANVMLHNFGLGSENGELVLYIPFYRRWMFDGLASFDEDAARNWLKTRLWNFNENLLTVKKVTCRLRTLDSFDLNPTFIKIDVEGYELEVLKGAEQTLRKNKPTLLVEAPGEEVKDYLSMFDYEFYKFENGSLTPGRGVLNTFCM